MPYIRSLTVLNRLILNEASAKLQQTHSQLSPSQQNSVRANTEVPFKTKYMHNLLLTRWFGKIINWNIRSLYGFPKWNFRADYHPRERGDNVFTLCVCLFVCVWLSVYVCHDVCPDDLTMKVWCHTNNILQVHCWGCLVVQVMFHTLMTSLMTSQDHKVGQILKLIYLRQYMSYSVDQKLKMSEMLMAIFLVYSTSGITSGKTVSASFWHQIWKDHPKLCQKKYFHDDFIDDITGWPQSRPSIFLYKWNNNIFHDNYKKRSKISSLYFLWIGIVRLWLQLY